MFGNIGWWNSCNSGTRWQLIAALWNSGKKSWMPQLHTICASFVTRKNGWPLVGLRVFVGDERTTQLYGDYVINTMK